MLNPIRRSLTPPTFGEEDKDYLARILHVTLLALLLAAGCAIAVTLITGLSGATQSIAISCVPAVIAVWLNRRGDVHLAGFLTMLDMLGLATILLYRSDGLQDIAILMYPVVILVAGLLLRKRSFIVLTGLAILSLAWIAYGQSIGVVYLFDEVHRPYIFADLAFAAIILCVAATAVYLLANNLRQSLQIARRNERALRASEEKFTRAFRSSPSVMLITDLADSRFIEVNDAFTRATGYTRDEVIGRSDLDMNLWLDIAEREAVRAALRTQGTVHEITMRFLRKSGETGLALVSGEIIDLNGARCGLYSVSDVTERRQAEAEREALIQELEAKNTELERFTYTVSHDLKSPLITIRGFLGYLQQDARTGNLERLNADIARITEAAGKMQHLLDELLELSRIGRMMNPPETVSFEAIAREAVELVQGRIAARGVRVDIAEGQPRVYGDRARRVAVVQNLVDNAAKFMGDQAKPRIEIGMCGASSGRERVFCVRDNGIGIEPKYHDKVFGLFDKLDPHSNGTGVGLALVKRIVEVHGGRIWIESEGAGRGAAFCFTLPERQAHPASKEGNHAR